VFQSFNLFFSLWYYVQIGSMKKTKSKGSCSICMYFFRSKWSFFFSFPLLIALFLHVYDWDFLLGTGAFLLSAFLFPTTLSSSSSSSWLKWIICWLLVGFWWRRETLCKVVEKAKNIQIGVMMILRQGTRLFSFI